MIRAARLSTAVMVVLAVAGIASAAEHWRGAGGGIWPVWGGDGTSWSDVLNWDDTIPSATTWDANRSLEQGTPSNHNIRITANATCGSGTIYDQPGYTVNLTVENGVTMTGGNPTDLMYSAAGLFTIKSAGTYDIRYGQFGPNSGSFTTTIEAGGLLYCSALRHNNGAMVDVYGELRAWKVSRISAEGSYRLAVHNGGLFRVDNAPDIPPPGNTWAEGGKVTQYIGSTVMLAGDQTGRYLDLVQAGEDGVWDVLYDDVFTYLTFRYNPCNLIVFADADDDGDVDQADFAMFQVCFTGDGGGVPDDPDYCACFNRPEGEPPVKDDDIDGFDLEAFEACATGPGVLADPGCDD